MSDCLFCSIVAGEIPATVVHDTDASLAFRDISPQVSPAHVLVIPRVHHGHLAEAVAARPGDRRRCAGRLPPRRRG